MFAAALVLFPLFLFDSASIAHPKHAAAIEKVVNEVLEKEQAPGISVAILEKGVLSHAMGYGFADLENEIPMRSDSICRIASVSKQFTAAAVMRLVEQKKVGLDDALGKYVAGFGEVGKKVTIRQMLHHTSGVADFTRIGSAWHDIEQLDRTPDQIMDLVRSLPMEFEPETKWAYNNSGYFLLGMVIEKAAGKSFPDYLEQDLLANLGLSDTRYGDEWRILKRRAQGYRLLNGVVHNDELKSMTHPYAAGSIVSTSVDLVKWSQALASGKVVSKASYEAMIEPGKLKDGRDTKYGFGLVLGRVGEHPIIWHNGGIHGFTSHLAHIPDADLHVSVLVNADFVDPAALAQKIEKMLLGIVDAEVKDLPISEEEIDACTGKYTGEDMNVLVRTDGETLTLVIQGQRDLRLKSQGELRFVGDAATEVILEFDTTASPAKSFLLLQGGARMTFERVGG